MENYRKIYADYYGIEWDSQLFEIHHINRNRNDNNIYNLVLLPKKLHKEYHKIINIIQFDFETVADVFNVSNYDIYHASEYQELIKIKFDIANIILFQSQIKIFCDNYKTNNFAKLLQFCYYDIYKKYIGGK